MTLCSATGTPVSVDHLMNVYGRLTVGFVSGRGVWLTGDDGRDYLDAISGIGVCSLGHGQPELAAALADQAGKLIHTSNIPRIPLQEQLADRLAEISGLERAFFTNSGAEAMECAVKLARLYHWRQGRANTDILVAKGSFHGRTLACISATDNLKSQEGFGPIVGGFTPVEFGDLAAIEQAFNDNPNIGAVMLEPIQGEGGINVPPLGFLKGLRDLCDRYEALLVLDEVQSGICKTGRWFAFQHEDMKPDILTCAKALGNGVPIGACLASERVAAAFQPGNHGSTFGGNPLACRAGLTVLDIMTRDDTAGQAAASGEAFMAMLRERLGGHPAVREIRGRGLMVGVELVADCAEIKAMAMEAGVLLNVTRGRVIRLLPPLVINQQELETLATVVADCVEHWHTARAA
ncbi:MAG: aspartate aminotransferase family protein [Pseudomonadota bacterium]